MPRKHGEPEPRDVNLSREEIVAAAARIIRESGVAALSMRTLSKELGKSHMAMYYHVGDKAELLNLVASSALAGIAIPAVSDGPWDERLRTLVGRIEEQLRSNPGIGEILLDRMLSADRGVLNAMMEILVDAGFDDAEVLMAYATVHTYLFGRYRVIMSRRPAVGAVDLDTVARVTRRLPELGGRDFFEFGLDTLIDGLRVRLARKPPIG